MLRMNADQIWRLLADVRVGRIATHDHERGISSLTPLLFAATEGRIYFATQPGAKLTLLRRYPAGVGLQCDQELNGSWLSAFVWGRYRDVGPGAEYAQAALLMARKYGRDFLRQIAGQASQAMRGGPLGIWRAARGATTGCIDVERIGGRIWRAVADSAGPAASASVRNGDS
jgi:hypothetical protein